MSIFSGVLALGLLMSGPSEGATANKGVRELADTTQPKTNVEPKPKAKDVPQVLMTFGFQLGGMPSFALGGEFTRARPFWVHAQLTEFVWVRLTADCPPAEWTLED